MAENFVTAASAPLTPSPTPRATLGVRSHAVPACTAAPNSAKSGASVVARPKCARIGGNNVKHATAPTASAGPNAERANRQMKNAATKKNGRMPSRAAVRLRR